jgi:hypothetical protein
VDHFARRDSIDRQLVELHDGAFHPGARLLAPSGFKGSGRTMAARE